VTGHNSTRSHRRACRLRGGRRRRRLHCDTCCGGGAGEGGFAATYTTVGLQAKEGALLQAAWWAQAKETALRHMLR
jgi:hypothetical protein